MIECPKDRVYTQNHVWVKVEHKEDCLARIGITEFMQEELPEILSLDLPMPAEEMEIDDPSIHLHCEDGIHDVRIPLTGRIHEVNQELLDSPELLHVAPYQHWIVSIEYDEEHELELMLDAERYVSYTETL
jgi:glycine cleavage system H protein